MTNRAAVLHAPGDVRVEERPMPSPGAREVVVEVTAVGVCGSDVHYYEHGRIGDHVVRAPMILGHESAGNVVEVGSEVSRHAVGDRVTLEPGVPCGRCVQCRAGRYNLCPDVVFFATPPVDGAFANFVAIHEDFAFALPDGMSDEVGALMEPLSVGIWACRKAGVSAGDRVLVTGAGPIGLLAAQVALAFGATEVSVSDVNEHRLGVAAATGATRTLGPDDDPGEVDALIECSGHPAAVAAGIAAAITLACSDGVFGSSTPTTTTHGTSIPASCGRRFMAAMAPQQQYSSPPSAPTWGSHMSIVLPRDPKNTTGGASSGPTVRTASFIRPQSEGVSRRLSLKPR